MSGDFLCLRRVFPIFTGALLCLVLLMAAGSAQADVAMIYPEPGSMVNNSRHLVLKLGSTDITGVMVTVNGVASDILPVGTVEYRRAFKDFLVLQPIWDKGSNRITVETFINDKKQESFKSEVFYALKEEAADLPKGLKSAVMHRSEADNLCVSCHNMSPTLKQVNSAQESDNACYKCHRRMTNQKYVHGPVSTFSCAYCHSLQGTPAYSVPKRETRLCFECHIEKEKELKEFKFLHGPVAGGMCEVCHDPHASDNPAQLHQPVNTLCLSCHEQVGRGIHAITLGDGSGHPISGKVDISDRGKGRPISCVSCHNPHGGKARYYFVTGTDNKMDLCQMCHKK